jgi:hypothetical protein
VRVPAFREGHEPLQSARSISVATGARACPRPAISGSVCPRRSAGGGNQADEDGRVSGRQRMRQGRAASASRGLALASRRIRGQSTNTCAQCPAARSVTSRGNSKMTGGAPTSHGTLRNDRSRESRKPPALNRRRGRCGGGHARNLCSASAPGTRGRVAIVSGNDVTNSIFNGAAAPRRDVTRVVRRML